jgi:hypothetical protein
MRKAKTGKYKGKEFAQTSTQVSKVLALPESEGATKGKSASRTNGSGKSTSTTSSTRGTRPAKKTDEEDIDAIATETLLAILADNDGSIAKAKLPVKILNKLGAKHPQKEEVRKRIYSDDFLALEDGWSFDKSSKQQTITVAEAD